MGILKKFGSYWDSRLDDEAVKRISAALGSFLLLIITAAATLISTIIMETFGMAYAIFFIILWGGLASYLGTFIVTVFGATEKLEAEGLAEPGPATDEIVLDVAEKVAEITLDELEEALEDT